MKKTKILAMADVIEAMVTHRPYRPALSLDMAMEEIKRHRGTLYDPQIVDICLEILKSKDVSFG
jgi:HD-GYP domain-containing protein (c-di-GMP phosphodiesterase class II)